MSPRKKRSDFSAYTAYGGRAPESIKNARESCRQPCTVVVTRVVLLMDDNYHHYNIMINGMRVRMRRVKTFVVYT